MTATESDELKTREKRYLPRAGTLRLYSGLVLMAFLLLHLINHSLGLISLDALEWGRSIFTSIWRDTLGTIVLLLAAVIHLLLVFAKLLAHRSYRRIPPKEILQIVMGLAIPPLLIGHFIGTRAAHEALGIHDSYAYVLYSIWVSEPLLGLLQAIGTVVAWLHGCLGLHFWLRLKPWYERAFPYLYSTALILPVLALTGFVNSANEMEVLLQNPIWKQAFFESINAPSGAQEWYLNVRDTGYKILIGLLILLLLSRVFWVIHFKRRKLIEITYPDGNKIQAAPGTSVLEVSQLGGIPHAAVCGGRGRCSTCRVRIISGEGTLAPPSDRELAVLKRVGAAEGTPSGLSNKSDCGSVCCAAFAGQSQPQPVLFKARLPAGAGKKHRHPVCRPALFHKIFRT